MDNKHTVPALYNVGLPCAHARERLLASQLAAVAVLARRRRLRRDPPHQLLQQRRVCGRRGTEPGHWRNGVRARAPPI